METSLALACALSLCCALAVIIVAGRNAPP